MYLLVVRVNNGQYPNPFSQTHMRQNGGVCGWVPSEKSQRDNDLLCVYGITHKDDVTFILFYDVM
jgi:hypothetical protein